MAERQLRNGDTLERLAETFKILGNPTRVKILSSLASGELSVGELVASVGISTSAVSHQLRLLKSHRLVRSRREGRFTFYSLDDEHVESLIADGLEHVREEKRR